MTKTLIDREIQKKSNDLKNIDIFSYKSIYFKNRTFKNEDDLSFRLKEISKNNNFTFWDFGETQCNYKELECDYITADGFKIYYDYGHFTLEGSKYFGEKIENYIIKEFKILN